MEGKVRKLESMQEYQDLLNPRLYKICLMIEEGLVVQRWGWPLFPDNAAPQRRHPCPRCQGIIVVVNTEIDIVWIFLDG